MQPHPTPVRPAGLANRLLTETLVFFAEVADGFPTRGGRRLHVGTLNRWRHPGVAGVRLEAVRVGGRWLTSWEAVDRFVSASSAARSRPEPAPPASPRRHAAVEQKLDTEGL